MSNPDPWGNQNRPLGQNFNRQHPPVLPPPATLETGGQKFYPLPSLPSLGNGQHNQSGHSFSIPALGSSDQHPDHRQHSTSLPPAMALAEQGQHHSPPHHQQQLAGQHQPQPHGPSQTPSAVSSAGTVPTIQSTQASTGSTQPPQQPSSQAQPPQPQPAQQPPSPGQSVQQQISQNVPNRSTTTNVYRPLNVKDALSYLDQVKIQFYNQADVYNNFLDIMKDFKSQSIDTPGVIDRVSTLFRGHPNLIQGFNTFLPPGYRIECSMDPSDPNPIRVTTPTGTTTTTKTDWHSDELAASDLVTQQGQQPGQQPDGNSDQMNHAITYVNKIKTRFANQPDIYKQFLEILQTYQREQKPIAEVYEQVTVLFSNSPDLLDDFKQFLPDTSAPQPAAYNSMSQLPPVGNFQPPTGNGPSPSNGQFGHHVPYPPQQQYPPASQFNQHLIQQQQPSQLQQQKFPATSSLVEASGVGILNGGMNNDMLTRKKKSISEGYGYDKNYNTEAQYSSMRTDIQPKIDSNTQISSKNGITTVTNPTLVPGVPEPIPSSNINRTSSLSEEINFFDKVKKAIGNKQTYNDFLKIINLYSQDIIDKETLIDRVESFIGDLNPELVDWFKMFVGFKEPEHIETIMFKKHQLELSFCKAYGPSYRQLPKAETYMPCSGRDEMCWEVLNDEWVGHPTWASEDSGFIAHRKNQYEEILFRIEEERLEYDYHMEANLRTIQTLETIANRIANMTPEQKANFKLPPGLGHTSVTIYKKVIRKIYDKDRGFEVIDALHENPAIAVPIVLKRLKQKDEEWRRAQREWNKVWREMEQKVFYKSLDHLGLTFKQADKKLLTTKQLISEISTVKVEQQNKRLYPLTPKPQEQLNYKFNDLEILYDILRLSDIFINKSSNYSSNDREKLVQFFQFFVSLFFSIPHEEIEAKLNERNSKEINSNATSKEEEPSDVTNETSDEISSPSKKRPRENDLLKDVLKKQSKSKKDEPEASPQNSESEDQLDEIEKASDLWISTTGRKFSLKDNEASLEKRDVYNLFSNTTIYVFFRHLTTLYQRLEEIKLMNEVIAKDVKSRTTPQFAKDLNLIGHQLEDMNVEITGDKNCYKQVLSLTERLLEGELEHQWFEESIRQAYKNRAYKIYTIDKVVQAMVKHIHTMTSDSKTSEMMVLFEADRKSPISTTKDQILYRMQVRSHMTNDENMFKIAYRETDSTVNIQFVGLDDLTINDHKSAEEHYNYYVTSYVMSHPTEGVPASKIHMPFSKDFIENIDEDQCNGYSDSQLKVSICQNSYRLFFEADTHDEFTTNSVYEKPTEDSKTREDKLSTLKKLLEDEELGWKSTLSQSQAAQADVYEEKIRNLFDAGIEEYKSIKIEIEEPEKATEDVEMRDAADDNNGTVGSKQKKNSKSESAKHPDMTIDDSTMVQANDTTIQQDGNDTTADDNTVNESIVGIVATAPSTAENHEGK
ncbi:hypothetical protein CANTEDRAFT_93195 [Yamadazyma tenuis ATCC 10573]|uniref:Histone deacetylase interacting domain-containing protein n=1 Tax=Candida tenuis (strain ATCC 10573 / BCRC 21748 / CBS 615 / JCM 9827 / NBRC 10315 / NRRL Y-1498 / VKM Y-70) TaxID=590646 RepID=G3B1F7_CANTC|nr:uncharacterized protein CANTEDRAFT_93195 [Yamadazyma tenuis ATCC 10573]EGV64961.1 hypothetical protein CANTEDRAFT_93195 [Yamadazyma tenuis ATCC 10573]